VVARAKEAAVAGTPRRLEGLGKEGEEKRQARWRRRREDDPKVLVVLKPWAVFLVSVLGEA
jgi:hypothetical protein